jgi:Sec-independent protein translocase protein TatA
MDSFFGIGAPELILILILAGIVMGPQRIRQAALWLGKTTAQLQAISRGFVRQLNAELDSVDQDGEIKSAMKEVQELRRQVTTLRQELTSAAVGGVNAGQKAIKETRELVENSIKPPNLETIGSASDDDSQNSAGSETPASETTSPPELPNLVHVPDDPEA